MVKIAIAGGSGQIAREVIDVLVATGRHEILILSRKDPVTIEAKVGVTWIKTDYKDQMQLTSILHGVHTVLSFITVHLDPDSAAQKLLIDAAVAAGVKRFAPSEWATSNFEEIPWYAEKGKVRTYLKTINKEKKILEYSLFQAGGALDYFSPDASSAKHLESVEFPIDFPNRRAILLEGQDSLITLTTVKDLANIVAHAVEYDGEWPILGGVQGTTLKTSELLEIGVKVRGGIPWDLTTLKETDVRAGDIKTSWLPKVAPPSTPADQADYFSKLIVTGWLLSGIHNAWAVSDEWNRLFPDYKFTNAEEFLTKHWAKKP